MAGTHQTLRRWPVIFAAGLLVLALAAIVTVVLARSGSSASPADQPPTATATATAARAATSTATVTATATPFAGILDGTPMTSDEWAARKDLLPLAVMFDNTPNSIPHHGIGSADLVYEAFVEGGITRLMAVFWRNEADPVMAVRSARTPFVIWVDELGALFAHAGSATTNNEANAAGQIIEWGIKDLDAFKPGSNSAYYRDPTRYAPYNLATSTARLRAVAAALGFQGPPAVESWRFRNPGDPLAGPPAGGIQVDFSGRMYGWQLIQWRWDDARKAYGRYQFGGPQVDGNTGEQLFFATVIVMRVDARVVDTSGHVLLDQIGEGPATVFTGGRAIEGTWRKTDRKARTRFYDAGGNEIPFERGPIFIEVLGPQSEFTITASAADLPPLPKYTPPPPGPATADDDVPPPSPTSEPEPPATATPAPSPEATALPPTPTPAATADHTASPEPSTATPGP